MPFCNFRSVPRRVCRRDRLKIAEGLYSGPFLKYSRAGIFPLFRNNDRPAGTFHWSKESSLAGTFHRGRFRLLKTGFFGQVMELKIRRKNPSSALLFSGGRPEGSKRNLNFQSATWHHFFLTCPHKPVEEKTRLLLNMPSNDTKTTKGLYSGMGHYERPPGPIYFVTK